MKYLLLTISLIASFSFFATLAKADRPCKPVVEACLSAGVIQRGASREVMLEKCVKPVVMGRGISGVKVDPSIMKACKVKVASME